MSADPNLKLTRSTNNLIIEDLNSIAGIKIEDGTYLFNSSFTEKTVCSAFFDDRFYTFSANGSFGSWDPETGKSLGWSKVYDIEVENCKIDFPSADKFGLLINQKLLRVTDISNDEGWSWLDDDI